MARTTAAALVTVLAAAAPAGAQAPPAHRDGADGLKALFAASAAACTSKAFARGRAITASVLPDRTDLKQALRDDVDPALVEKILAMHGQLPAADERAACLLTPGDGRTEITPHAATTDAIRAYAPGTTAFQEFPGGARTLAEQVLRPGVTFYEVEITRPGEPDGMKYHLLFWNGSGWKMLGPVWRALR